MIAVMNARCNAAMQCSIDLAAERCRTQVVTEIVEKKYSVEVKY